MRLNLELEITDLPRVVKILKCRYGNTNELPQLLSMCIDEVVGVQQDNKIPNQPSHREMIDQTSVCIASLEGSLGSEGSKLE